MTAIILIFLLVGVIYYITAPVPISVQIEVKHTQEEPAPITGGGAWFVPDGTVLYDRQFGSKGSSESCIQTLNNRLNQKKHVLLIFNRL